MLALVCFNKHVEKDFLQHGLGTPYSISACFDKEDIWNFCSFLYSACQLHLFWPPCLPSPQVQLDWDQLSVFLGQLLTFSEEKKKTKKPMTFHPPKTMVYFRFSRKKKNKKRQGRYFLMNEVAQIIRVRASVFEFSIGDKHAKIICVSPARGEESKHAGGACVAVGPC